MIAEAWAGAMCERIRAMVCGCSSMMKVSRFWLSTFCRKPKGKPSIDCRTLSMVAPAALPSACSTRFLATSRPPTLPESELGLALANSWITCACSSAEMASSLAISIETDSICLGVSLPRSSAALLFRQARQQDGRFADRSGRHRKVLKGSRHTPCAVICGRHTPCACYKPGRLSPERPDSPVYRRIPRTVKGWGPYRRKRPCNLSKVGPVCRTGRG